MTPKDVVLSESKRNFLCEISVPQIVTEDQGCFNLKKGTLWHFETSVTTRPTTSHLRRHVKFDIWRCREDYVSECAGLCNSCSLVRSYQSFTETCCLHVHKNVTKAAGYFETSVTAAVIFSFRWFQADRSQWPLASWNCRFKYWLGHGCLVCVLCVVQVQVCARGRSLVHSSPSECVYVRHWVWSGATVTPTKIINNIRQTHPFIIQVGYMFQLL